MIGKEESSVFWDFVPSLTIYIKFDSNFGSLVVYNEIWFMGKKTRGIEHVESYGRWNTLELNSLIFPYVGLHKRIEQENVTAAGLNVWYFKK